MNMRHYLKKNIAVMKVLIHVLSHGEKWARHDSARARKCITRARICLLMARNGVSHGIAVCMERACMLQTDLVMMAQVQP